VCVCVCVCVCVRACSIDGCNRELIPFLEYLEREEAVPGSAIASWGISQTTLEDVFLRVTRRVYEGGRNIEAGHIALDE
jgi:hypothetical protein